MAEPLAVAVIGPSTLVGEGILELLEHRGFPMRSVRLLGSERTAGSEVERSGRPEKIELLRPGVFADVDVAFFAAGPNVAANYTAEAVAAGATAVDTSTRFRLDASVPLVIPGVNSPALEEGTSGRLVASPSSPVIALSRVLGSLAEAAGLRRVVVSTYQGAAGAGRGRLRRLSKETLDLLSDRGVRGPGRLAFNCVPQVGVIEPGGPTTHELEMAAEVRKVLDDPGLALSVTAVRVPIFFGHGLSVALETESRLGAAAAAEVLGQAPGIHLHHGEGEGVPTPTDVLGSEAIHVGRLRDDPAVEQGLMCWIAFDNVLASALNAVAIAEHTLRERG